MEQTLNELISYALERELIEEADTVYVKNRLLDAMGLTEGETDAFQRSEEIRPLYTILDELTDDALKRGLIEDDTVTMRDLFDTELMGILTDRPAHVIRTFRDIEREQGIEAATAWFYEFSQDVHYIRRERIAKNRSWQTETDYGALDITINLSKPEKDPKEIAKAKEAGEANYPLCLLCKENEGYSGRVNHPARQNLRVIPVTLAGDPWFVQFSPYVYYHEHAIVLSSAHEPMSIRRKTFERLLDFVEQYPHYFIGSNADLPIVGGSILSHDHYQAGKYEFPMARAEMEEERSLERFADVTVGRVKWPMSVVRVKGESKAAVIMASEHILQGWRHYTDESVDVRAFTGDTPHHTITPIARKRDGQFELDLVLRDNQTSSEHPSGIYHPHEDVHHIKKENIGLIEVMGLAVLPGRLDSELKALQEALAAEDPSGAIQSDEAIQKHHDWAMAILSRYGDVAGDQGTRILQEEVGQVFHEILHHSGVFKRDDEGQAAFTRFLETLTR
ncbi:UDP-glucose--hexose-1-phosphate uridylyltransferase [Salisediminibacterium selenitireducens]|uniref:Galactose-1-phosphate uridylyltransferase n=1 Tax=Bacillus selenitireducens (strain ATCC 700615 / DSM 15326 / MLS10) TaxID=439292 RepID=D6XXA3_BACIE|nr:UDP-glucose--hexose-1-phosphate uridylyltransferase [Salisediminibacterium selenitireducens]ADH97960.1 galactose-1-phosphate uridylyltransferase [[Bacillus] selenitireducens MLS10]